MAEARRRRKKKQQSEYFFDYSLLFIVLFLLGFGLIMIYSASSYEAYDTYGDAAFYMKKQLVANIIGLVGMIIIANIPYHFMDVGPDAILVHERAQDVGVAGGYFLVVEPLKPRVMYFLRYSQGEPAFAETQMRDNLSVLTFFYKLILANDAYVGNSVSYTLWNVIVSKIQYLQWKIGTLYQ